MSQYLLVENFLKERNMSFNRLAELIGIKRTTLLYGLNNNKISLNYLSKIADVLECSVAELIPDEVDKVVVNGKFKYNNQLYDLSDLNDFVAFIDVLLVECGIQSEFYYVPEKK